MKGGLRAGIHADDLTGACDTGAVFAARGLETLVLLPEAPLPPVLPPVLVLDTESRARPAAEARAQAREAAGRLAALGAALLYTKVDSTLRGALAAVVAGALEGARRPAMLLSPAFPAQRRTVRDGCLRIAGRPAEATAVARDPLFPATGASVLALLGVEGPHPVGLVPLATVRRGPAAVAARLRRTPGALVADAERDGDLAVLAEAGLAEAAAPGPLLAGSAGLAGALAARLAGDAALHPPLPGPLLVVAGSAHPLTHVQLARLAADGVVSIRLGDKQAEAEGRLASLLPADGDAVVAPPAAPADDPAARAAVAARLAALARRVLEGGRRGTLLLTGGETAVAVLRALGASGLRLTGDLEPGLAVGTLRDGPFAGLTVVTKAGGFGDPDTLRRVRAAAQAPGAPRPAPAPSPGRGAARPARPRRRGAAP